MHNAHVEPDALDAIEGKGRSDQNASRRRHEPCLFLGTDARESPNHGTRLPGAYLDERQELGLAGHDVDFEGPQTYILTQNDETARDHEVARGLFRDPPQGVAAWRPFHLAVLLAAGAAAALSPLHCVRVFAASQSPVQSTAGLYLVSCLMQ
jgi:hypothetical protein